MRESERVGLLSLSLSLCVSVQSREIENKSRDR